MNILQTEGLTKVYSDTKVVDSVSLTVEQGDIYGFVRINSYLLKVCIGDLVKSHSTHRHTKCHCDGQYYSK